MVFAPVESPYPQLSVQFQHWKQTTS